MLVAVGENGVEPTELARLGIHEKEAQSMVDLRHAKHSSDAGAGLACRGGRLAIEIEKAA